MSIRSRIAAWLDYDARRAAARSAAVDRDIARAGLTIATTYDVVHAATTQALHHEGTNASLVVPHVIDRVAREVTAALDAQPGEVGDVDAIRTAVTR